MIAETTGRKVQATLPGEKIAMGISEAAKQHIMDQLADLYADRPLALVREYSTNALDSHLAAGVTRPIEVSLPGPLSPMLRIKDFGLGLSHDDLRTIYSQYGASTKRDSNDFNGTLGFGCKAAFSYGDSFNITATQDGVRVLVAVARDEHGAGTMTVVDTRTTDDPNGVEVAIPVKGSDYRAFQDAAKGLFRFWAKGSVLVDGQEPEHFEGLKIADGLYIAENEDSYSIHPSLVVMGGVAYPTNDIDHGLERSRYLVAFVEIGDVTFVPSREALKMTNHTRKALEDIGDRAQAALEAAARADVAAAPDRREAIKRTRAWVNSVRTLHTGQVFKWQGLDVPWSHKMSQEAYGVVGRTYTKGRADYTSSIGSDGLVSAYFVEGYSLSKFTANHRRKVDQYFEDRGISLSQAFGNAYALILTENRENSDWISDDQRIKWSDINAIKLPRVQTSSYRSTKTITGSYYVYDKAHTTYPVERAASDLDTKNALLYVEGNRYCGGGYADSLDKLGATFTLVTLPANRVDKFKRDFPGAKPVRGFAAEKALAWSKTVSADDKLALACRSAWRNTTGLADLDPAKLMDPDLREGVRLLTKDLTALENKRNLLYRLSGTTLDLPAAKPNPTAPYPLAFGTYGRNSADLDHIYLYCNAVYAANTHKKGAK